MDAYPDDVRELAVEMVLGGRSVREVSDAMGIHHTTIDKWVTAARAARGLSRPSDSWTGPPRCPRCRKKVGYMRHGSPTSPARLCVECDYQDAAVRLAHRDQALPRDPVGARIAALCAFATYAQVGRYLGVNSRIVRRAALRYTSAEFRRREEEQRRPNPERDRYCAVCGGARHLSPTCPDAHPDRDDPDA